MRKFGALHTAINRSRQGANVARKPVCLNLLDHFHWVRALGKPPLFFKSGETAVNAIFDSV